MVLSEPPYPLPPRHARADLGRNIPGSHAAVAVRLLIVFVGLSGYFLFPLVAFGGAAFFLFGLDDSPFAVRVLGFIVCVVFGMVGFKGWLPRRQRLNPTTIPATAQPLAVAFIQRVAEDLAAPFPEKFLLASGTTLRLDARVSFLRLLRGPQWEIQVGLWLWQTVNLSEFKALMARTLAPLSRGRLERLRVSGALLLEGFLTGDDAVDDFALTLERGSGFARLVRGCFVGISFPMRGLAQLCHWCTQLPELELQNDLVAVRLAGSDSLVHAVYQTDVAELLLSKFDDELIACRREGVCTADLYAHRADALTFVRASFKDDMLGELPSLRGQHAGKYVDVFEPSQKYYSEMWDDFPSPSLREAVAKKEFVMVELDERPAQQLLANLPDLRLRFTRLRYQQVLQSASDLIMLPPETVRRWLNNSATAPFAPKFGGAYDEGRLIEPGKRQERESALLAEEWDDARLSSAAATLYVRVAPVVQRWQAARKTLRKLLHKTLYRPMRKDRERVDDLDDERIKSGKWLAALDQRAFVIHVHMAARLPDLRWHEELLERYRSVLRFQLFVADAREYRDRTAAFADCLAEVSLPSYTLRRDAASEFTHSREDFEGLLADAARLNDPLLATFIDQVPLEQFLYSHEGTPSFRGDREGRRLLVAWNEIVRKADWLHHLGLQALLELHEKVVYLFREQTNLLVEVGEPILEPIDDELTLEE
jgi:hypothetical protein